MLSRSSLGLLAASTVVVGSGAMFVMGLLVPSGDSMQVDAATAAQLLAVLPRHRGRAVAIVFGGFTVGVAGHDPHARGRGKADHVMAPSKRSTQRTLASSTASRSRTRVALKSISITPFEGRGAMAFEDFGASSIWTVTGNSVGVTAS